MNEPETVLKILREPVIHVVGLSDDAFRPSNSVSRYLQGQGYRIVPVNPNLEEVLGEQAYPDLRSAQPPPVVVNVFRRARFARQHVEEAMEMGAQAIWLQLGVVDEGAAREAEEAGLWVVMDRCIAVEHRRLRVQGWLDRPKAPSASAERSDVG